MADATLNDVLNEVQKLVETVNVDKKTLTDQVAVAAGHVAASGANASAVAAINGVASTQAGLAGTSAASAQRSEERALAAWASATYPNENLAAVSSINHIGTVVKTCIYDTSKDSDGGAWRLKQAGKSWREEAIYGTWLGRKASEAEARGDNLTPAPQGEFTSPWGATQMSTVDLAQPVIAPNGVVVNKMIVPTATAASHYYSVGNTATHTGIHVLRTMLKKTGAVDKVSIYQGASGSLAMFDLTAGTASKEVNVMSAEIASKGDGWYELTVVWVAGVSHSVTRIYASSGTVGHSPTANPDASGILVAYIKSNAISYDANKGNPEKIANGDFSAGTAGWVAKNSANLSVANGELVVASGGVTGAKGTQLMECTPGKTYVAIATMRRGTSAANALFSVTNIADSAEYGNATVSSTSGGTVQVVFTPTEAQAMLQFRVTGTNPPSGDSIIVDNVSVKEVTVFATPYESYAALANRYYQNTTDGKFYALNATYGQTEIFRGNTRDFPAVAGIVAESARVVIYDLTKPDVPMAFVFSVGAVGGLHFAVPSCVAALNGKLLVGGSSTFDGVYVFDFASDTMYNYRSSGTGNLRLAQGIANRNTAHSTSTTGIGPYIVNDQVNDLAVTVLPDAPVDPVSGLPVATVAVATAGGVSVIKHDGTVVNSSVTGNTTSISYSNGRLLYTPSGVQFGYRSISVNDLTAGFSGNNYNQATIPSVFNTGRLVGAKTPALFGPATAGLVYAHENPATPAKGMIAAITNAYNSGWQIGDARLSALADVVPEVITATNVLNETFDYADTAAAVAAGWTISGAGNVASGILTLAANEDARKPFTTVPNKTYVVLVDVVSPSNRAVIKVGTAAGSNNLYNQPAYITTTGTKSVSFTATGTTTHLTLLNDVGAGSTLTLDNVKIDLAEPDRSVKNKALTLNGTLQKQPVASGAQLVAYSGFSAANYLEQPYNADLDFGTGDFCVMGWVRCTAAANDEWLVFRRDAGATAPGLVIAKLSGSGLLRCTILGAVDVNTTVNIADSNWHLVAFVRVSGVLYVFHDGNQVATAANTTNLTNANAVLRVGVGGSGNAPAINSQVALVRISATAPSPDQIRHIFETERKLFEPNAKCTIDGTSSAVTALAYDEDTDLLHVGTSWGRSAFKDLVRVESNATDIGAITSIAASGGMRLSGGTSARVTMPAVSVRAELRNRAEAKRAQGRIPVNLDFDSQANQTRFPLPRGFVPQTVIHNRQEQREGVTKDFTVENDGFGYTVVFATGRALNDWVRIKSVRG